MSQDLKVAKKCGSLDVNGPVTILKSNVTQLTNLSTAVATSASTGVITTVSATTAANSSSSFVVNNPRAISSSTVILTINNYAGTQGRPVVRANGVTDGQFTVVLTNVDDTNALNGVVKIAYLIV